MKDKMLGKVNPMEINPIDKILGYEDTVQVELQNRPEGKMLYVTLNGITILRIHAYKTEVKLYDMTLVS